MKLPTSLAIALASVTAATLGTVLPADAACRKMGFVVNDYGKDGPTKDAQSLLEKDIARWAAEKGIKTYNVGKKDVSCFQFLNFIVFDEHTCTASATVCWDEKAPAGKPAAAQEAKADATAAPVDEKPAPEKAAAEIKPEAKPATKKVAVKPAAAETPVVEKAAAVAKPEEVMPVVDAAATDAKQPVENASKVETGAVQDKLPDAVPTVAPAAPPVTGQTAKAAPAKDPSQIAAEAAERAAAAAERAAIAAERAAQAAMDAQNQISGSANAASPAAATSAAASATPAVVQPITPLPATAKP